MMHPSNAAWFYLTRWGTFSILPRGGGRWHVFHNEEDLGSYHSPEAALDDLLGDHCFSNRAGLDTSKLGLPDTLGEWQAAQIVR